MSKQDTAGGLGVKRRVKGAVRRAVGVLPPRVRARVSRLLWPAHVDPAEADAFVAVASTLPPDVWEERGWRLMRNDPDLLVTLGTHLPFEKWEERGWHLTPNHFYSVIPDTRELPDRLWQTESELPGVDMRDAEQVALLTDVAERFGAEYDALPRTQKDAGPGRFFVDNKAFESVDGEMYYSMIRLRRPATVLEIGSGWSTLLALEALRANRAEGAEGRLVAIEPYPYDYLREALAQNSDIAELRESPLQEVPLSMFEALGDNDILFIDSSHVLKIGSDVQYEFLQILPRLRPGVSVHVHDIFLPGEYPKDWVLGPEHRFWNEQYLLNAYLADNDRVEVLWGSSWMHRRHPDELEKAIASYDPATRFPGSFWFRRR
jgi:predicted O-methyltransferase YrrM